MLSVFRARITVARISSLLLLFTLNLPACDGWVNWIYPPFGVGQITYNYLDEVWFTWQSNYTDPGLYMYCVQESINAWVEASSVLPVKGNGTNKQTLNLSQYRSSTCHVGIRCTPGGGCTAGTYGPDIVLGYTTGVAALTWGSDSAYLATATSTASTTSISSAISTSSASVGAISAVPGATSTSSAVATSSASPLPSSTSNSTGLSAGAKAGIGIGAALGVLLLILMFLLILRMRGKRRQEERHGYGEPGTSTEKGDRWELGAAEPLRMHEMDSVAQSGELDGHPMSELQGQSIRSTRR